MAWADDIVSICQTCLPAHYNDCSGFAKDVAQRVGVLLFGDANDIVDLMTSGGWTQFHSGIAAGDAARQGYLVIAGAKAKPHGHVAVVVPGPMDRSFPYAYWGMYHGVTVMGETVNVGAFSRGHGTVNYSFGKNAQKNLVYGGVPASSLLSGGSGGQNTSWSSYLTR